MSRPRRGLGQGLEALVRDSDRDFSRFSQPVAPASNDAPPDGQQPAAGLTRWEYVCLGAPKKRARKPGFVRLWFSSPASEALQLPRPLTLSTPSAWAVIGLLGEEGWELVAMKGRRFYFKRPLPAS